MPWVERDGGSNVIAAFARKQPGIAEEFLADAHADVVAFNARKFQSAVSGDPCVISAKGGVAMNADGTFVSVRRTGG